MTAEDLLTDMLSFSSVVCNLTFTALKPNCQTKLSTNYFIFDGQVDVQGNCSGQRSLQRQFQITQIRLDQRLRLTLWSNACKNPVKFQPGACLTGSATL